MLLFPRSDRKRVQAAWSFSTCLVLKKGREEIMRTHNSCDLPILNHGQAIDLLFEDGSNSSADRRGIVQRHGLFRDEACHGILLSAAGELLTCHELLPARASPGKQITL